MVHLKKENMSQETETVTIALCTEETEWHDEEIIKGDGWNIEPSDEFLGIKGRIVSRQIDYDSGLSDEQAKKWGIEQTRKQGFWILEIDSRTVIACFGFQPFSQFNIKKMDRNFRLLRIEVKPENLKREVTEVLGIVARGEELLTVYDLPERMFISLFAFCSSDNRLSTFILNHSKKDILRRKGFGPKKVEAIKQVLKSKGIKWK